MTYVPNQRIERVKWLLANVRHAAMATVNKDGSPHNSPVFFQYDSRLNYLYWSSSPESQHSKNVARTGDIFVVLYEAHEGGGLYIRAANAHATEGDELAKALELHNRRRVSIGREPLSREYYEAGSPQCMYKADIQQLWVNMAERGDDGHIIRDYRYEIAKGDLL